MRLMVKYFEGYPARYRPDSTDEKILRGLITKSDYRMKSIDFDVKKGEHWLDLGANVGAFGIYCKIRGATADCYEPDPECFEILQRNCPWFINVQAAVTHLKDETVILYESTRKGNHYRNCLHKNSCLKFKAEVNNIHCSQLIKSYSGIKMDIEGSEFGLIDNQLLPKAKKLVLEYHSSRDPDPKHMKSRLEILRLSYKHLKYQAWIDRRIAAGQSVQNLMDPVIFCWN